MLGLGRRVPAVNIHRASFQTLEGEVRLVIGMESGKAVFAHGALEQHEVVHHALAVPDSPQHLLAKTRVNLRSAHRDEGFAADAERGREGAGLQPSPDQLSDHALIMELCVITPA